MRIWLKDFRKKEGLTIKEVADNSGISASYYQKIESGKRGLSISVAKKISKVLGFDWVLFFHCSDSELVEKWKE